MDCAKFMNLVSSSFPNKSDKQENLWYYTKCECGFETSAKSVIKDECPICKRKLRWEKGVDKI